MPAIKLARLKIEAANLADKFGQPSTFLRQLHELCDIYAERTRRPGQSGEPPPLLSTYKVPAPVLRQVFKELSPYVQTDSSAALDLADAIWAEPFLEFRLLAALILGEVSPMPLERVVGRIKAWANRNTDDRVLTALVENGLARLRQEASDCYLKQTKEWLISEDLFNQRLGLRALLYLIKSPNFENEPVAMRLIAPLLRSAPGRLRPDIVDIIQALARRSPRETAYFLRQNLEVQRDDLGMAWVVRNSLRYFPLEIQDRLRQALREADRHFW